MELRRLDVCFREGVLLDFGGVAKGWAADQAAEAIASIVTWAVVDAGGDVGAAGDPGEGGVEIAVEDPVERGRAIMRLILTGGAVATTSLPSRRWGPGLHQIIDPRPSRPAATGVIQATTWADTCVDAEIRSKWLVLAGPDLLGRVPGVVVMEDGRVITNLESVGTGPRRESDDGSNRPDPEKETLG